MEKITRRDALGRLLGGGALAVAGPLPIFRPLPNRYQVIVYGGTPAGIIAAAAAAREGVKVALVDPSHRLGGMISGGLGFADLAAGYSHLIGGLARSLYFPRITKHYGNTNPYQVEPHVAEAAFRNVVREAGVHLYAGHPVVEVFRKHGSPAHGPLIKSIRLDDDTVLQGNVFIDCSYEGDLMARSGVSYTVGRESINQYGESMAGVQASNFVFNGLSPYGAGGKLLPEISPLPPGAPGQADTKIMAYNFRLCLSDDPANKVPFPKPPGYDSARYELLRRIIATPDKLHATFEENFLLKPLPNHKFDLNDGGFFSTDYVGGNYGYPEASYTQRWRIWQQHYNYMAGMLYFVANDPSLPSSLREEAAEYGLARDEFVDTNNWPTQLYVREARRMIGAYVMTQHDVTTNVAKPDSVGMGAYPLDCHYTQRVLRGDHVVEDEGDLFFAHAPSVSPYQFPYRALLPLRGQVANLLVPVCMSASHVAYCSLRTEGQYMVFGHAAGVAATIAVREYRSVVNRVPYDALAAQLIADGAVLTLAQHG